MSASPHMENELTFLATNFPPGLEGISPVHLVDTYIAMSPSSNSALRLRQRGSDYEITKKVQKDPNDASSQAEYTIELSELEYNALNTAEGDTVAKDRYKLVIGRYIAEIDVFQGPLSGLVVVEFEFASEEERSEFSAPAFCGADVTQEKFIAGSRLAGKTLPQILPELDRFGYEPLFLGE